MKKLIIIFMLITMFCFSSCVYDTNTLDSPFIDTENSQETANVLSLDNIHVYTSQKEPDGDLYTSFILSTPDKEITFSARQVVNTDIQMFVEELTGDSYPDVAAVFVYGNGTGVHREEIHIFDGHTLEEYPVEDMLQNLTKHVSLESDSEEYRIVTDKETYYINKAMTGADPEFIFEKLYVDSINTYTVSDGAVHYITECQCGPGEFCGQIDARLRFDGEIFVYDSATYIVSRTDIK